MLYESLCMKTNKYHKIACIQRKCEECGVKMLKSKLPEAGGETRMIVWKTWEPKIIQGKRKKVLVPQKTTLEQLVDETSKAVHSIASHLFVANWQRDQYEQIRKCPPAGLVVMTMDFSENYRCEQQREISSAFFAYEQVTLHTSMANYKCSKCDTTCTEYIAVLSDDLLKDHNSVRAFSAAALFFTK